MEKQRTPIPVALLRFPPGTVDGPGISAGSRIRHREAYTDSRHTIEYRPWERHFVVQFHDPGRDDHRPMYIHEDRPLSWEPLAVADAVADVVIPKRGRKKSELVVAE